MSTRNVVLTDHQDTLVDTLIESGRYESVSDVVREGLRLVEASQAAETAKLDALRAAAGLGLSALDRGAFVEFSDASTLVEHLKRVADDVAAGNPIP